MITHDFEQGSDEWAMCRAGLPTGSCFSKLITSTGEPSKSMPVYASLLAAELYAKKPLNSFEGNGWTDRGTELEPNAVEKYEFLRDCEAEIVGFVTDDAATMGCSPDRLIGDKGMIEVKCLKTENHVATIQYYKKNNKVETKYVQQTQGQMYICQREWCDVVFYHPDLPMLIIRQEPIKKVVDGLAAQVFAVNKLKMEILQMLNEV